MGKGKEKSIQYYLYKLLSNSLNSNAKNFYHIYSSQNFLKLCRYVKQSEAFLKPLKSRKFGNFIIFEYIFASHK
jgi:hypothetical protein